MVGDRRAMCMCDRAILCGLRGTRAAQRSIMPWFKRAMSRWYRWTGERVNRVISSLTSAVHRVGAPTLLGVPVSAVILSRVAVVQSEQSLDEVAQLFVAGRHDVMPVLDHGRTVAVITRRDIADGLERVGRHAPVTAATTHQVITVAPSDSLAHVLQRLHEMPDAIAVVVDQSGPVGMVTEERLIEYLDGANRPAV
jgi:predicted transcriptional regulator